MSKQNMNREELLQYWIKKGILNGVKVTENRIKAERETADEVLQLIKLKVINWNETIPARCLLRSAHFRLNSTKDKSKKLYYGIHFDWENHFYCAIDIIRYKKDMWKDWRAQTKIWLATMNKKKATEKERLDTLATIDRIIGGKEIGYILENIQCLSKGENDLKAKSKPCKVLVIKDKSFQNIQQFETLTKMQEKLLEAGVPINVVKLEKNTGKFQEINEQYSVLIETENAVIPQYDEPIYKFEFHHKREVYDMETGKLIRVIPGNRYTFDIGALKLG